MESEVYDMATTYYFLPTRNLFGEDSVKETGTLMQSLGGRRALIVTDGFLAKNGMAEQIQKILSDAEVESVVFDGVEPNPKDVNVEAGLKILKRIAVILSYPWAVALPMTVRKRLHWWLPMEEISVIMRAWIAQINRYAR